MTLFFTGHRGFLGRELIPLLSKDYEVVIFEGDLSDFRQVEYFCDKNRVDRIIHAAFRGGRRNKIDTSHTLIDNISTTLNILRMNILTLNFCSGAVYDRKFTIKNVSENDSLRSYPGDYYGQSKFILNQIVKQEEHITTFRFFNVFGPTEGLDRFISYNISQYIEKKPMMVFKDFYMDFFYINDAYKIIQKWIEGQNLPKELNLVYEEKYLLSDVCNIINSLDYYEVPVKLGDKNPGKDYTGSAERISPYSKDFEGLQNGIGALYTFFKS